MSIGEKLSSLIVRPLDWFIPEQSGPDAEALRLRARALMAVTGVSSAGLVWTGLYQLSFGSSTAAILALCAVPIVFATVIAMRFGVSIPFLTSYSVATFFILTLTLAVLTGGKWPGGLYFLALAPALAVLLTDRAAGTRWLVVTFFSITALALVTRTEFFVTAFPITEELVHFATFRVAAILSVAVFSMATVYSSLHDEAVASWRVVAEKNRESELRFRAIAENANDLIAELDREARMTYASPGYLEVLGYSPDELIGCVFIGAAHPDDLDAANEYWKVLLEKGSVAQRPLRFKSVNRGWRWLEVSMRSFQTSAGELRIVAISRDVTDRIHHELSIRRQERLAAMGTMAAGAAHQLNNPLGAIVASAQLAKVSRDCADFPAVAEEVLDQIEAEAVRCGQVLRSMLSFSREEASERWPEKIDGCVRRAVNAVEFHIDRGSAEIVLSLLPDSPEVLISPIEIEQVIINLLSNSIRAEAEVIVVGTVVAGQMLQLTISDDGVGLSETERAQVFDPFYTTRPEAGSGLGLTIAREIIRDHGGSIEYVDAEGEGTVVRVQLPLAPTDEPSRLLQ